jgi:predicted RNase H-like HicB family nuclease
MGRRDGESAAGAGGLVVEDGPPDEAVVGALPDAAVVDSDERVEAPLTCRRRMEKRSEDQWHAPEDIRMIEYKAAYYHDRDSGWYTASVLDFPGVLSEGKTLELARRMLGDALREMTEWLLEDGQPLPRPDRPRTMRRLASASRFSWPEK